jgi:hypothetical protein
MHGFGHNLREQHLERLGEWTEFISFTLVCKPSSTPYFLSTSVFNSAYNINQLFCISNLIHFPIFEIIIFNTLLEVLHGLWTWACNTLRLGIVVSGGWHFITAEVGGEGSDRWGVESWGMGGGGWDTEWNAKVANQAECCLG